jgi:glycosyltransferase involved in cell wall biosynthesis
MIPTQPKGGTEILVDTLKEHLDFSGINLIASNCRPELVVPGKKNILLQGLSYDQDNVQGMRSPSFVDSIDCFIYVSHWCYEKFREKFNAPAWKSVVIKNATTVFDVNPKPKEKLKFIYTSTPWRGLHVLLKAFRLLNRSDVELDVYSSTVIYGTAFAQSVEGQFDLLFEELEKTPGINVKGYAPNEEIRAALKDAHIFAYPSTFEETSCISAIEAMCAGCKAVVTNYGALFETCGEYGEFVCYDNDHDRLAQNYAIVLNRAIDNYWSQQNQECLFEQTKFYNQNWTWPKRFTQWQNLLDKIRSGSNVC